MHAHLSGNVGQYLVAVLELDAEHGVRQRLDDRSLENDRVFLGLGQCGPPKSYESRDFDPLVAVPGREDPAQSRGEILQQALKLANSER